MMRITSDRVHFELDAPTSPIATVPRGEAFVVETRDALDGQVTEMDNEMSAPTRANPVTGPLAVEGVSSGDSLRVDILAVDPAPKGYLTFQRRPLFFEQADGVLHMFQGIRLAMMPMIGTIGVLPANGTVSTKETGIYGGNMDTRDVTAGSSIFLTSNVDGAGLYVGDVHSLQGDGETSGQGVETAAEITLRVQKTGQTLSSWPHILREGLFMLVVSADTLDDAAKIAVEETAQVISGHSDLSYAEARMLMGVCGDLRIGQVVNPQKTVRFAIPISAVPWNRPTEGFPGLF